jgi:uncharacterized protein (DUF427 family)
MAAVDDSGRLISAPAPRWVQSPKWVRAFLGGEAIADTKRAHLLREGGPPVYYFPIEDVRMEFLRPTDRKTASPDKGEAAWWTIDVKGKTAENAAWSFSIPLAETSFLKGYMAFEWNQMDGWFEEREEVFGHARDPFKRVEVLGSSRHVKVVVARETVADSKEPAILFEPNHPIRYYLPKVDVRMDLLQPSGTVSHCPYKGNARYYSVAVGGRVVTDVAWSYPYPTKECAFIAGKVCFLNERLDALYVEGELVPKPKTRWS